MKELSAVNQKLIVKIHHTNLKDTAKNAKKTLKTGWKVSALCYNVPSVCMETEIILFLQLERFVQLDQCKLSVPDS
jgi:hypothetical protein